MCALALPLRAGTADAPADPAAAELTAILRMPDLFDVMAKEGAAYGEELDKSYFGGEGGADWRAVVARIYAPDRLAQTFDAAFARELAKTGTDPAPALAFLRAPLGRRIVDLEISARVAMLDDDVEAAGGDKVRELEQASSPRLEELRRFADANHLIDMNVTSALNANIAFLRGLSAAAPANMALSEDEILSQVWSQEDSVRASTSSWLMTFLVMAYSPLADRELGEYITFSETPEGSALNRALFAAYDAVFSRVSGELGWAVGQWMQGTNL